MIGGRAAAMAVSSTQRMLAILVLSILSITFMCSIRDDDSLRLYDMTSSASREVSRQLLQKDASYVDDLVDTRHIDGYQYMQLPWVRKAQEVPATESVEDELIEVEDTQTANDTYVQPYSLQNVLQVVPYFKDTFAVLVYDPKSDKFIMHYPTRSTWKSSCFKLVGALKWLVISLRTLYPERFNPSNSEFAVAISSGDYPQVKYNDCIRNERTNCISPQLSPILQFGSVFQRPMFPSLMAMPMPLNEHLGCYNSWATNGQVCASYLPRSQNNPKGLIFPEHVGLEYDELIPQVVWRGTDFSYLHSLKPNLRRPSFEKDVASHLGPDVHQAKVTATKAMRNIYDDLIARWKGVVWTAEAEREAEQQQDFHHSRKARRAMIRKKTRKALRRKRRLQSEQEVEQQEVQEVTVLPWCNIKFSQAMRGGKTPTSEIEIYQRYNEYGIPAGGEYMSLETLGQYKYHIDLGGGGGTTWTGTLLKLGLPGLLLHHVTPTKDYIHDKLQPWIHYVPIKEDLSDLKEKYEWAESHPEEAKRISENATKFARRLGTPEGMAEMFHQFYDVPLRRVIEAYQPVMTAGSESSDWQENMTQLMDGGLTVQPFMTCAGYHSFDCKRLADFGTRQSTINTIQW